MKAELTVEERASLTLEQLAVIEAFEAIADDSEEDRFPGLPYDEVGPLNLGPA